MVPRQRGSFFIDDPVWPGTGRVMTAPSLVSRPPLLSSWREMLFSRLPAESTDISTGFSLSGLVYITELSHILLLSVKDNALTGIRAILPRVWVQFSLSNMPREVDCVVLLVRCRLKNDSIVFWPELCKEMLVVADLRCDNDSLSIFFTMRCDATWNMKMKRPWKATRIVNIHCGAGLVFSNTNRPEIQVIPRMTLRLILIRIRWCRAFFNDLVDMSFFLAKLMVTPVNTRMFATIIITNGVTRLT